MCNVNLATYCTFFFFLPFFSGQSLIVWYHFASGDLPNVDSRSIGRFTVQLRVLNLWVNLVIWKVHNRGPCAGPSAIYIQPMHDIRYYLPDEVDVFWVWNNLMIFWLTECVLSLTRGYVFINPSLLCGEGFSPEWAVRRFHCWRRWAVHSTARKSCYCSTPATLHSVCSTKQACVYLPAHAFSVILCPLSITPN